MYLPGYLAASVPSIYLSIYLIYGVIWRRVEMRVCGYWVVVLAERRLWAVGIFVRYCSRVWPGILYRR
jgi:hypothetical protein